jgi:hypothetical protein
MKHLITLLFFVGAIAFYIAGSMPGATALLMIGVILESLAWYRVLRGKRRPAVRF